MNIISDRERAELLKKIMSTPVGGGRRFLVECSGSPCAGFDDRGDANAYVAMMTKDKSRPKAPGCAKMNWSILDRG